MLKYKWKRIIKKLLQSAALIKDHQSHEMERKGWWLGRHPKCEFLKLKNMEIRQLPPAVQASNVVQHETPTLHTPAWLRFLSHFIHHQMVKIYGNKFVRQSWNANQRSETNSDVLEKKADNINMAKCVTARWSFIYRWIWLLQPKQDVSYSAFMVWSRGHYVNLYIHTTAVRLRTLRIFFVSIFTKISVFNHCANEYSLDLYYSLHQMI